MIYQGSRYETATVVAVKSDRGWTPTVFREVPVPLVTGETIVGNADTLQSLASRAYGDPELWWHIADANPEILYPDRITAGTVVKIPYVSTLR